MQAGGWQGISEPLVFDFPPDLNLPYESREALLSKAGRVGVVGVRLNVPKNHTICSKTVDIHIYSQHPLLATLQQTHSQQNVVDTSW